MGNFVDEMHSRIHPLPAVEMPAGPSNLWTCHWHWRLTLDKGGTNPVATLFFLPPLLFHSLVFYLNHNQTPRPHLRDSFPSKIFLFLSFHSDLKIAHGTIFWRIWPLLSQGPLFQEIEKSPTVLLQPTICQISQSVCSIQIVWTCMACWGYWLFLLLPCI